MQDVAIACHGVWKSYRIYHQRSHTLKEKILTRRNAYEEFWALQGIDLDVPVGETLGIVGPNGSGKSTLLKTMARILTPNKGTVQVFGTMSSLLELGTGFHHELTGRENVYLGGSLLGQSKEQVDERYDEIVDFAGIERFMDMPVKNYSSGMYARLAFAVAISVEPEILLVDEVLSVGDESFQMKCYERIAEFRAQGRTIVLVSHSLASIRSLCSEAVWIEEGIVRQTGKAHDVVAGYLSEVHSEAAQEHGGSREGHRWGSGLVRITGVSLEGAGGVAGAFRTGDPMKIRISYDAQEAVDDVSCGIAIYQAETLAHVFGQNTHEAGIDLRASGSGTIEFEIAELPLLKGNYVLTIALHDHAVAHIYDWHERRYSFMVFENPQDTFQAGLVRVDGTWRTSSSPVAAA
jgi:ABC-type polysaccharide/polyol phosphate transport system ATPase subunit